MAGLVGRESPGCLLPRPQGQLPGEAPLLCQRQQAGRGENIGADFVWLRLELNKCKTRNRHQRNQGTFKVRLVSEPKILNSLKTY